jgi:hypothetical protein
MTNPKEATEMFQRLIIAGILILSAATVAMAAEPNPVDGHWQGTVSGPNGDFTINFTFKADGAKLTGSVETPNGEQPISDGKIEGDKLSFNTKFQDNVIEHEGTISGDTIQLKVKGPWGEMDMTLKRVTEKKSEK